MGYIKREIVIIPYTMYFIFYLFLFFCTYQGVTWIDWPNLIEPNPMFGWAWVNNFINRVVFG